MNKQKKYIAGILLMVLASIIVPPMYLHELLHGDEKKPVPCSNTADDQIGQMHEHCCNFQFSIPPLHSSVSDFQFQPALYKSLLLASITSLASNFVLFIPDQRGPPCC